MKTYRHFILFVLTLLMNLATLFSQSISSLKINPLSPTTTDQIKSVAVSHYGSSGCSFKGSSVNIVNDTIKITSQHQVGLLTMPCSSTDTILIGQLPIGFYTLIFYLKEYQTLFPFDSDTIHFSVGIPTNYETNFKTNHLVRVYPNPTTSTFYIKIPDALNKNFNADVFNFLGQKISSLKNISSDTVFDLANRPDGTYFILIQADDFIQGYRVQKNAP